jgi:hypothetical protein
VNNAAVIHNDQERAGKGGMTGQLRGKDEGNGGFRPQRGGQRRSKSGNRAEWRQSQ